MKGSEKRAIEQSGFFISWWYGQGQEEEAPSPRRKNGPEDQLPSPPPSAASNAVHLCVHTRHRNARSHVALCSRVCARLLVLCVPVCARELIHTRVRTWGAEGQIGAPCASFLPSPGVSWGPTTCRAGENGDPRWNLSARREGACRLSRGEGSRRLYSSIKRHAGLWENAQKDPPAPGLWKEGGRRKGAIFLPANRQQTLSLIPP